jgi:hypothetical protein
MCKPLRLGQSNTVLRTLPLNTININNVLCGLWSRVLHKAVELPPSGTSSGITQISATPITP